MLRSRAQGAQVSVDDLTAGMVIAEEMRDQQGRLLMPAGTELTERHLRAFQLWGIMTVRVLGRAEWKRSAPLELTPEQLAEGEAHRPGPVPAARPRPSLHRGTRCGSPRCGRRSAWPTRHGGMARASDLLRGVQSVASLPGVYLRLSTVVSDPRSSAADVGRRHRR